MPLRDHFHAPLSDVRSWTSLHGAWATFLAARINQSLPAGFFAEPLADFGIEIDVAALDIRRNGSHAAGESPDWPTAPTMTVRRLSTVTDEVGVRIYAGGPRRLLVGAIELVSPANKDRPESRDAFVSKGLNVLRAGVGLVVVDIVTTRRANLHRALLDLWGGPQEPPFTADLYAVAYRPILREGDPSQLDLWAEELAVARPLPTLPLWLLGVGPIGVELEATYEQTLRELRFDPA